MAAERGSAFLLKIGDGAATPAYATVAGLKTTQLSINGNKGSGGWRELLSGAGVRSVSVAASGIYGLTSLVSSLLGSPGRATGGPVSAGRSYVVGERGPELFVPSSGGRIEHFGGGGREVRVGITIQSPTPSDPQVLRQSSRQVARAIRSSLRGRT